MLVGVKDRYVLIDAGLMFPDFADLGMQKILPDTSFLHEWRDKIEAVIITHGHEDHIGALPWVVPALDPSCPIYTTSFVSQLVTRRLTEFTLYNPNRFRIFNMREPFSCGPFEVEAMRVTHSIPDCCGLILRSEHGSIVHTGDWKIDETPIDGQGFDRETFDMLGKENIALMMSDSTNVLSPGRTTSERVVQASIAEKVLAHAGKGRVICTQFASNLHRMYSVKHAADLAGRKICFVGASLNHYLEAAWKDGRAPIDPKDLINPADLDGYDPNEVLIITTGSQAEPRAQLSLASREASNTLKIKSDDLILYSAKVIPGNEGRVVKMLNSLSMQGARVIQGRADNLHTSGHAYQEELKEVLRYVKPQHFLPVHGEYSFLCEHARLAKEEAGVNYVQVIKNGQMLGVHQRRNRNEVSSSSMAVIGEAQLVNFYNDGFKGTGSETEMALSERTTLAFEGVVVAAVDVYRGTPDSGLLTGGNLRGDVRVTVRGMWTDQGRLLQHLHKAITGTLSRMDATASLQQVERQVIDSARKACKSFNNKMPEVICVAHEHDPRVAHIAEAAAKRAAASTSSRAVRRAPADDENEAPRRSASYTTAPPSSSKPWSSAGRTTEAAQSGDTPLTPKRRTPTRKSIAPNNPSLKVVPEEFIERRKAVNPRDQPLEGKDVGYD
jgi:beta-CASP RNase J family ribonuclease